MTKKRARCEDSSSASALSRKRFRPASPSPQRPRPQSVERLSSSSCAVEPPTRPRARSVDSTPPPAPLTEENLSSFEASQPSPSPASLASRPASPARSNSNKSADIDDLHKLNSYHIYWDTGAKPADDLQWHIDETIKAKRAEPPSPNAQEIVDKRRKAGKQIEFGATNMLEKHLLFEGEDEGGPPFLAMKPHLNLSRHFLPEAPSDTVKKIHGPLSRPQPDRAIGYVSRVDAAASVPKVAAPFSAGEEDQLDWYRLCLRRDLHFPFLTAQFKSMPSGQSTFQAACQSARDGATICDFLHHFYSIANGSPPSAVESCHFSITCDVWSVTIWVHWRETNANGEVVYNMEPIHSAFLQYLEQVQDARRLLRNIIDWALGERLASLKTALPLFWDNRPAKPARYSDTDTRTDASSVSSRQSGPLTPASDPGDPLASSRKRQRVQEVQEQG